MVSAATRNASDSTMTDAPLVRLEGITRHFPVYKGNGVAAAHRDGQGG